MSGSERKAAGAEATPPNGSILDYLYNDARRVGSFLSQFEDIGQAQEVKATDTVAKSGKRGFTFFAGSGIPDVAEGKPGDERGPSQSSELSVSHVRDPFWRNARSLLDHLVTHHLVEEDFAKAKLGQFVLAKGSLKVLDLGVLKGAWELSSVKQLINNGVEHARGLSRRQRRLADRKETKEPAPQDFVMEMLGVVPHGVQALLAMSTAKVWCALLDEAFVTRPADIACNHGIDVGGEWNLLGLLDAVPDDGEAGVEAEMMEDKWVGGPGSLVGNLATVVQPLVRQLLGRPRTHYGVTPLLIFRKVGG